MRLKPVGELWRLPTAFALLSALVAYGYSFGRPNLYNQIPVVAALLDPNLYSQDFYIQEMAEFTPRFYYYHLMVGLVRLGFSLPVACFGLFVLAFGSTVLGLWAVGRQLGRSPFAGLGLAFLGLSVTTGTLGRTDIFRLEPIAAVYAMGVAIWGIYYCSRRQWQLGYLLFGLACLLQFLVGVLPAGLWGLSLLYETARSRQWRRPILPLLILGLLISLVYIPMALAGNTSSADISSAAFVHLYGEVRHPHHIILSTFPAAEWTSFLSLLGAGALCLQLSQRLSRAQKRDLGLVMAGTGGALLLGYLLVEIYPVALVAKLQLARTTPFALIAALAAVAVLASEYRDRDNHAVSLLLLALPLVDKIGPGLLLGLALLLWLARRYPPLSQIERLTLTRPRSIAIAYALFLLVLLVCWAYLPVFFGSLAGRLLAPPLSARTRRWLAAGIAVLVLFLGLQLAGVVVHKPLTPLHRPLKLYPRADDDLKQLAAAFAQLSPEAALVLVPPSDDVFRFYAQRSVVVTFKSFPFTDQGILTWQQRLADILGPVAAQMVDPAYADWRYSQRSGEDLAAIAQRYGAGYLLTQAAWHPDIAGRPVAAVGDWVIWQLTPSD
ncbi:MAG: hypothetical protein F6J97_03690 [Leptolyngbya sp. SIO4C1]|nr:hypothetical protein [Leptolyngbya sp. SIO4C1]